MRPRHRHDVPINRQAIHSSQPERCSEKPSHLYFRKELRDRPMGIKTLSLFFVEAVADYRRYDEDGNPKPGPLATIFEEEYAKLAAQLDFQSLFTEVPADAASAHDGYFSQDKKGRFTEPTLDAAGDFSNARSREDAERTFDLIMKNKERLLDEAEPRRFLFSHSALREGWDHPNVFQICSLREMASETRRRQSIGRRLRLCVDQTGQRRRDEGLNVLTVIAQEGYREFADPQRYLTDLLTRLVGGWPQSRIDELMPWCWTKTGQA